MGRITTGIGLVSGINSKDLIDQLMALEARPKDQLTARIENTNSQKLAFADLIARLAKIKLNATTLKKPSTFTAATSTSSDEDVLTATTSPGAAVGTYQFQVARMVTTQQSISAGFVDFTSAKVGAGTITIEQGGGEIKNTTTLAQLRGGAGIRRGQFKVTDSAGKTAIIDVSAAVTLEDVVKKINTSLDISVKAKIDGDRLSLTDLAGGAGNMSVADLADGHSAGDLGISGSAVGGVLAGSDINYLSRSTSLSQLNDGRGIRLAGGTEFTIALASAPDVDVALTGAKTVGDIIDAINSAGGGRVTAGLSATGNNITLTATGSITVTATAGSNAAVDLGIVGTASDSLAGKAILGDLGSVLISSLKGGAGMTLGKVRITDRAGGVATVDLSGATTIQNVLDTISNAAGTNVTATFNGSGNGIRISDDSGGSGSLLIENVDEGIPASAQTATALGIAGTFDTTKKYAEGTNLQRQWITENTLLSSINGGKGMGRGKIKLTNSAGSSETIDLSQGNEIRISHVLSEINARNMGVTASINANGDGILLTDTAGGSGKLRVEEVDSTTAADLNLLGTATATTIDGSWEKTITTDANDTLSTLQTKISTLNFGVNVAIINDGSADAPYRLSLTAKNGGFAGRVLVDGGATSLATTTLVQAQDAAVFLGGSDTDTPLLITAGRNQLAGVVPGVTLELHGVSSKPVTLSVTTTSDSAVEQMQQFTDGFNEIVDKIKELTKFDTDTNKGALLLGNSTIRQIETELYAAVSGVMSTGGRYRIMADVGLKVGTDAKLEFDEDKFKAAIATDPDAVKRLFTFAPPSALTTTTPLTDINRGRGVRTATSGPDFQVTLRDGTTVDVTLGAVQSIGGVLTAINSAGGSRLRAEISTNGKAIQLVDTTAGTGSLTVSATGNSLAVYDLGINKSTTTATLTGEAILNSASTSRGTGLGTLIETRLTRLIDPVSGLITTENKALDARTQQFQDRITQMTKLLDSKRSRLERQFATMESVLAKLQTQQTSIGQIKSLTTSSSA